MKKFVMNKRNNKIAENMGINEAGRIVLKYLDGETRDISEGTLKRWFGECEAPKTEKLNGEKEFASVVESHALNQENGSVFEMNVKGRKALKINGHMYAAIRYSSKGVELWIRSTSFEFAGKSIEVNNMKFVNHTFDARIKFSQLAGNEDMIVNILDAAMKHQLFKKANTKKALAMAEKIAG